MGAALLILALLLNWLTLSDTKPPEPPGTQQSEAVAPPPPPPPPPANTEDAPAPPKASEPEQTAPPKAAEETQAQPDALPDLIPPTFDVVRIDPNGDAVVAGRANAGAKVTILDAGSDLGEADADGRGEWVYLPGTPLEPGPHELRLKALLPDGRTVEGDGTVVLVVPKPGQDIAGRDDKAETAQKPLAILVPDEAKPGVEVIQAPPTNTAKPAATTAEPEGVKSQDGTLSIETIDYDQDGNISMAGKGPADTTILAYLDNDLVGLARVGAGSAWRINPKKTVAPGVYTLRLDAVRGSKVVSRLELPFSRAAPLEAVADRDIIIVQPGNSLWRIARRTLGSGYSFTVIYEANADQIANPDLIYPGQVFEIPKK